MRVVKIEKLTHESFAPFGEFYSMTEPSGYSLDEELHRFFPDRISEAYTTRIGISPMVVKKPAKMVITQAEYHTTTPELILALNDDMVIHAAPASNGKPVPDLVKAFCVPMGTMVKLKTAIWHLAPLPVTKEELQALIILPECTYANDCTVVALKEEEQYCLV